MQVKFSFLRTSAFRLTAIYLIFFGISICAVLGYVYFQTVNLLERQNEETIKSEVAGLSDQFASGGVAALTGAINRRVGLNKEMQYMLADKAGDYIAGNLHAQLINDMPDNSWVDFAVRHGDQKAVFGHQVRGYNLQLPEDYQLLVGMDVEDLLLFRSLMRRALYWGLGFAGLLGLMGGLLASRNLLRRIDAISESSRDIMRGNLSGRMPIRGSGDELDRLSLSLNEMLDQIERLMQGMHEVSSNVAHDLRTPLTRLRARIEAALRQNTKSDYKAALQQTLTESDALLSTFNALMSLNQLDSGQLRSGLVELDLTDVLNDVVELYEPLAEENNGLLQLDAPAGLLVRGKRELLAQALINLIDNALKYGQGADGMTRIRIEARKHGALVLVSVSDHGPGIPAQDRDRVLKRFVRLDASRSKLGNGLGLSLVASVANLMDGKLVLVDNRPGLRAELSLPYAAK